MASKFPENIQMEILKLYENPKKFYQKFSKSIQQDVESKSLKTLTFRLICFNEVLSGDMNKETVNNSIQEFVSQGMVKTMLWDAFVDLISQPVSQQVTSAMMVLLQTLCNLTDNSLTDAKSHLCVFLPLLLKDVIGNEKNECRLRIEGAKLINSLLEQNLLELRKQIEKIKNQKTICDDIGTLISNAGDFELQAQILEMVFRLVTAPERSNWVSSWFENKEIENLFLSIDDTSFEPGCRKFLNKLNNSFGDKKRIFSMPCQRVLFGSEQIALAKDTGSDKYWIDFNFGSKTLKFFVEEKEENPSENEDDDLWWHTVTIELDNVLDCNLFEQQDGILLKMTLKENVAKLIPSWSPNDIHSVQFTFGSECDPNTLRDVLERFTWIRPDRNSSSPKASVAIYSVHLGDRQKGQMEIIPTITPKPPADLMEEDVIVDNNQINDTDITASLENKIIEESEEILISSSNKSQEELDKTTQELEQCSQENDSLESQMVSQELTADRSSSDAIESNQLSSKSSNVQSKSLIEPKPKSMDGIPEVNLTKSVGDTRNNDEVSNNVVEADVHKVKDTTKDSNDKDDTCEDRETRKRKVPSKNKKTPPKKKASASDNADSSTDSGSKRPLRRSPRGHASNKRAKSPLPVEIINRDRRKYSSSSGKSSTDNENEGTSPSKDELKKTKTYPTAFNIDKRMQAKKNNMLANRSQEIKKKVFGQRGSSFSQKTSLHMMAPARRVDHSKGRHSPPLPASKKQPSRHKKSKTVESPDDGGASDHTNMEDNEKEVIEDSMPLDDSPKVVRRWSDVPRATERKVADERLTQSQSSKKSKQRVQFDKAVPPRLGTILRKGGRKERASLAEENNRSGWGSSTPPSSSTSETDWPGPGVEPGPKPKHSLVPCKSVRETKRAIDKKKRASVSPGLSAISEEKSPVNNDFDDNQEPQREIQEKTIQKGVKGLDGEEKAVSGYTSEETVLYESTSTRKTRGATNTLSNALRSNGTSRTKENNKHSTNISSSKPKGNLERIINFVDEFDFDLPDLTIAGQELAHENATLLSNPKSPENNYASRDKSADKEDILLEDEDKGSGVEERHHKPRDDVSRDQSRDRDTVEDDIDHLLFQQDKNDKKKSKSNLGRDSKYLKNQLSKRGFSGDEFDKDDFNEYTAPKRRKTYGSKQTHQYVNKLQQNWSTDKNKKDKIRTSYSNMEWQPYSPLTPDKLRSSNKGSEMYKDQGQSGYDTDGDGDDNHVHQREDDNNNDVDDAHKHDDNDDGDVIRNKESRLDKKKEKGIPHNRKTKAEEQKEQGQHKSRYYSSSISKTRMKQDDMEGEEDESNEVLKLRRFCQDITKSSTPASKFPLKNRGEGTVDGNPVKRIKGSKTQSNPDEQKSDESGRSSPKRFKYQDGDANQSMNSKALSRSTTKVTTNERFGRIQAKDFTSKYKTPSAKQGRMNDSGIGETPPTTGTESRKFMSTGSTTTKRRKGELLVTTSLTKTPITPRTSAIMRRIDEEEDFGHVKKPRQNSKIFADWTSSGPSRTVSSPFQDPFSSETKKDDHQESEQKKIRPKPKLKGVHNPNIRPRQLFRQVLEERSREDEGDETFYAQTSTTYDDMRDISEIVSGLEGSLLERLRRKRNNLQRFCQKTFDVTIETITRHLEKNHSHRDKVIDSFNDQFLEEIKMLKEEMDKSKKNEDQILARIEEDMKSLKTRRILQENKIKGLRNLCVEFQSEMIKDNDSQSGHQDAFQDEIRQELIHLQEHFLIEAQKQDRENLRRSLTSVLDATMM